MDEFLKRIGEIESIENKESRADAYADFFQNVKYRMGPESVVLLLKMAPLMDNSYQVCYHLFNHFLFMKMPDEALKLLDTLSSDKESLRIMHEKYPFMMPEDKELYMLILDDKRAETLVKSIFSQKEDLCRRYFELSVRLKESGIENVSDSFFNKAIELSEGKARVKIILSYCQTLLKRNRKESAKSILSNEINNSSDEDSKHLMYKLASIYEEDDTKKAMSLYCEIEKIDADFLDIKEKINKLTNIENKYKINKIVEDNLKDDTNIHF